MKKGGNLTPFCLCQHSDVELNNNLEKPDVLHYNNIKKSSIWNILYKKNYFLLHHLKSFRTFDIIIGREARDYSANTFITLQQDRL